MPGWTETLSAAGAMTFACTIGLMHFLKVDPRVVFDIIPCDIVSNMILVTSAFTARGGKGGFNVSHATSSSLKPLTI